MPRFGRNVGIAGPVISSFFVGGLELDLSGIILFFLIGIVQ